jgi:hypothetical protein
MTFRRHIASAETSPQSATKPSREAAMFKPLIFSLTLVVALCACSKNDDAASNNIRTPPANAIDSSKDAAGNGAIGTAQGPARLEPESEGTPKEAAVPVEALPKKHKKQAPNAVHDNAKGARSVSGRRWSEFQAMVDRCDTETGAAREQCLKEAKDAYRSANFKCDALAAQERENCLQFAERWNNAVADAPTAAVKHAKEPTTTATSPGDPRPAERNRDSTKQQQDAVGTLPEASKPN